MLDMRIGQICKLVQEHDCRSAPRTPTITNYYANRQENASFWMSFFDIDYALLIVRPLVFIRGRFRSKKHFLNLFQKFENTLPKLFLFLFPRPFIFFAMHQGSQQGRVGMRILLETPPVNPFPSDYPPYFYRRNASDK